MSYTFLFCFLKTTHVIDVKYNFWCDKCFVVTNTSVTTNVFVTTKCIFCHDKSMLVAAKLFAVTRLLSPFTHLTHKEVPVHLYFTQCTSPFTHLMHKETAVHLYFTQHISPFTHLTHKETLVHLYFTHYITFHTPQA